MTQTVNLYEAKTHLSHLVERAANGEEIIIAKAGKPKARLVPVADTEAPRQAGAWVGKVWIADDFDEALPEELINLFEGTDDESTA